MLKRGLLTIEPKSRSNGMTVYADKVLVFDFSLRTLKPFAAEAARKIREGVESPAGRPSEGTKKRQKRGQFWARTGRLKSGIEVEEQDGALVVVAPSGRLDEGFVAGRLVAAVPALKNIRTLLSSSGWGRASEKVLKKLVTTKRGRGRPPKVRL